MTDGVTAGRSTMDIEVSQAMLDGNLILGVCCHDGHGDGAYEMTVEIKPSMQTPEHIESTKERLRNEMRKHRQEMHAATVSKT